jgi:hypothetical protein
MAVGEVLIVKLKIWVSMRTAGVTTYYDHRILRAIFEVGVPLSKKWTKSVGCIRCFDVHVFKPDFASY